MKTDIMNRFEAVLTSGEYILGPAVERFERSLANTAQYRHAVGCTSGTDALIFALKALELEPGAEIVTPAYSFVASANAVVWAGYRPVFADVDLETGNVTAESVEKVITSKTKAVMAVDLYGRQAPIKELRQLCQRKALFLIEDGAQSIGVPNQGADLFTTSFYPTKNLGSIGDAGAVLTDDPDLATRIREMIVHGGIARDHYTRQGTNGRMDTIHAEVLGLKLPKLESWTTLRRTISEWYRIHLTPMQDRGKVWLPNPSANPKEHVWALFTVRLPRGRETLMKALRDRGVGCAIYYPKALPDQPSLKQYAQGKYPNAERLSKEVLSLPIYPELTGKEFDFVVKHLSECLMADTTSSFISP